MKRDRHGQASIISDSDYAKIRSKLKNRKHRLLLDLAKFTGERWGAIVQLRIEDVFEKSGPPRQYITFRAATRKAAPDGRHHTRQVPVHALLKEILEGYQSEQGSGWLFESKICPGKPITLRAADSMFRSAVALANLDHKGYSTHSTRRTFITRLYERGIDLHTIQQITGHQDMKSLILYVEADPNRILKAIAVL